nr:unnamed protein product [Digitaria exilis]
MTILFSILSDVEYETAGYTTLMESLTHEQMLERLAELCVILSFHLNPWQAKFFGGFLTAEALIKKMNKLLGIPEENEEGVPLIRNPPWIWFCLKSYRLDKNDPWGSRRYRVFGTEIRD